MNQPKTQKKPMLTMKPKANPFQKIYFAEQQSTTNDESLLNTEDKKQDQNSSQKQVLNNGICWSTSGNFMCCISEQAIQYYQLNSSQLRFLTGHKIQDKIYSCQYLDQHTVCFNCLERVQIWDMRQKKQSSIIKYDVQESTNPVGLMTINTKNKFITICNQHLIKNYDFRYLKVPRNTAVSSLPIYELAWSECENQILISGGGSVNKGILQFYDDKLEYLDQMQLHYHPIIHFSIDKSSNKIATLGQQNLVQICSLPDILSENVLQMSEQKEIQKCYLNHNSQYLALKYSDYLQLYQTKNLQNPIKTTMIDDKSEIVWHPKKNFLVYKLNQSPIIIKI